MKKIFLLIIPFIIFSCISSRKVMDSWIGSNKQQLLMSWGPLVRSLSDAAGGEILVYSRKVFLPATQYMASQTYWENKCFYVNSDGKIYHWLINKEQIPPQQIDLNIYMK